MTEQHDGKTFRGSWVRDMFIYLEDGHASMLSCHGSGFILNLDVTVLSWVRLYSMQLLVWARNIKPCIRGSGKTGVQPLGDLQI